MEKKLVQDLCKQKSHEKKTQIKYSSTGENGGVVKLFLELIVLYLCLKVVPVLICLLFDNPNALCLVFDECSDQFKDKCKHIKLQL